jgi:ABC-2 type transport system ATP-binding protein
MTRGRLRLGVPDWYSSEDLMSMKTLIRARNLSKSFGDFTAVAGVDLDVHAGEVLALLGPNGAGKTTTIRMLASILTPSGGSATIVGHDVASQSHVVRRHIGLLTEHHGLYTRMKPMEYLCFFGRTYGMSDRLVRERALELMQRHGLAEYSDLRLGEFSKGMRQKLALVRALLHEPPVLLLDEPTSAMDPASARQVRDQIIALRSSQRAIVVCTHNLAEAELLASRIAIISRGKIVAQGTIQELRRRLLGAPIIEVQLTELVDGVVEKLPPDLPLIAIGADWFQFRSRRPEVDNPHVLKLLLEQDCSVLSISEVGRSLEDVYLQVVAMERNPLEG